MDTSRVCLLFPSLDSDHSVANLTVLLGVLGQSLVMTRFKDNFPSVVNSSSATGWLTSILQLGGILGSVSAGVFGEVFSRKYTMFSACLWVVLGSYLYTGASYHKPELLYAGRFFTGLGVGTFSGVG